MRCILLTHTHTHTHKVKVPARRHLPHPQGSDGKSKRGGSEGGGWGGGEAGEKWQQIREVVDISHILTGNEGRTKGCQGGGEGKSRGQMRLGNEEKEGTKWEGNFDVPGEVKTV